MCPPTAHAQSSASVMPSSELFTYILCYSIYVNKNNTKLFSENNVKLIELLHINEAFPNRAVLLV